MCNSGPWARCVVWDRWSWDWSKSLDFLMELGSRCRYGSLDRKIREFEPWRLTRGNDINLRGDGYHHHHHHHIIDVWRNYEWDMRDTIFTSYKLSSTHGKTYAYRTPILTPPNQFLHPQTSRVLIETHLRVNSDGVCRAGSSWDEISYSLLFATLSPVRCRNLMLCLTTFSMSEKWKWQGK